jgi:hypothetical protein
MPSPLTSPAFLQRDSERRLGQLDTKQLARGDGYTALEDACEEGAAYTVKRLGGNQSLDHEAGVEGDRIG